MGACSHQDITIEKNNEMKEQDKIETFRKGPNNDNEQFAESTIIEKNTYNDSNMLKGCPPPTGFKNNENIYYEVKTEKIDENEFIKLEEEYPKLNDDIEVEKRNPQKNKDNNTIYYGEWDKKNNIRHGRGIQIWPDGAKYIGYWKNDKANGKGKLFHVDGDLYDGEWLNDKPNGFGIYTRSDRTKYEEIG